MSIGCYRLQFVVLVLLVSCVLGFASTEGSTSPIDPTALIQELRDGNLRFVTGTATHPNADAKRLADLYTNGQKPFVTILSCSDSRVPPELLFDQGFGDLFVVRVAGNVADIDEIGTIEYGVEHLGTPLLLVLGHSNCGAVTAVLKGDKVGGSIPQLVDNIAVSVRSVQGTPAQPFSTALLQQAIEANVEQSIRDVVAKSEIVRELMEAGKLRVLGGTYDLSTARVEMESYATKDLIEEFEAGLGDSSLEVSNPEASIATSTAAYDQISATVSLVISILTIVFSTLVFLLLYHQRTRIQRIKFKPRLLVGALSYVLIIGVSLSWLIFSIPSIELWAILVGSMSVLVSVLLFVASMSTLANYLGEVYHRLKQTQE